MSCTCVSLLRGLRVRIPLNADPDPDPAFNFNADPDPSFHLYTDPDPASHEVMGIRDHWSIEPPSVHGSILSARPSKASKI